MYSVVHNNKTPEITRPNCTDLTHLVIVAVFDTTLIPLTIKAHLLVHNGHKAKKRNIVTYNDNAGSKGPLKQA